MIRFVFRAGVPKRFREWFYEKNAIADDGLSAVACFWLKLFICLGFAPLVGGEEIRNRNFLALKGEIVFSEAFALLVDHEVGAYAVCRVCMRALRKRA